MEFQLVQGNPIFGILRNKMDFKWKFKTTTPALEYLRMVRVGWIKFLSLPKWHNKQMVVKQFWSLSSTRCKLIFWHFGNLFLEQLQQLKKFKTFLRKGGADWKKMLFPFTWWHKQVAAKHILSFRSCGASQFSKITQFLKDRTFFWQQPLQL